MESTIFEIELKALYAIIQKISQVLDLSQTLSSILETLSINLSMERAGNAPLEQVAVAVATLENRYGSVDLQKGKNILVDCSTVIFSDDTMVSSPFIVEYRTA